MNVEPLMKFLYEKRIPEKQEEMLKKKFRLLSRTAIGKEIGVKEETKVGDLPLTSYPLYSRFFENPTQEAFMYALRYYTESLTTGSMGKAKWYLNPIPLEVNMAAANLAAILALSSDGEKYCIREGYAIYANIAPPPYYAGVGWNRMVRAKPSIMKLLTLLKFYEPSRILELSRMTRLFKKFHFLPLDQGVPYQEKVDIFISNFKRIDIAMMTVGTLLNLVYPRIGQPIPLKAFVTQDTSADFFRDKIKEITGVYPSTIYGSTETGTCGIPSPEHSMGIFFDWRTTYCEFLPEDRFISSDIQKKFEPEVIPLDEVEVGRKYQLVATTFHSELTRYVMPDVFECISKGDNKLRIDFPIFKYYMRAFKQISLHNFTIIDERTILSAVKAADIEMNNFTARLEVIDGMDHLALYLEPGERYGENELLTKIHRSLCDIDKGYLELSAYQKYIPLRVILLPEGTFSEFMKRKVGMPHLVRVETKKEDLDLLLSIGRELRS